MADSNSADFAFVEEATWGTTPASALQTLRITGESLTDQEESTESAEVLSDRQLRDVIRTGRFSQGDISFELSAGTLDTLLEGVMADVWASNVLENGSTKHSYTFEKKIAVDGSPAAHFFAFKGCRLDTLSLNISRGSVITGTIGAIGKSGLGAAVTAGSGAYTAAGTTSPVSAVDLTALTEASASPGNVTEVTLNLTNNIRRQMALGSADPIGYGYGGFRASGMLTLYFQDRALYDKYVAETKTELEFVVTDNASKSYTFTVPSARWGPPEITIAGVNDDIFAAFPWTAVRDSVTGSTISITRVP
jgi:hypothetical protein